MLPLLVAASGGPYDWLRQGKTPILAPRSLPLGCGARAVDDREGLP
jgi:hypothetical protein